jgi:hypothetical protein
VVLVLLIRISLRRNNRVVVGYPFGVFDVLLRSKEHTYAGVLAFFVCHIAQAIYLAVVVSVITFAVFANHIRYPVSYILMAVTGLGFRRRFLVAKWCDTLSGVFHKREVLLKREVPLSRKMYHSLRKQKA